MGILSYFANDLPIIGAVLVATIIFFSIAVLFIDVPPQLVDALRDEIKRMEGIANISSLGEITLAIFSNNAQVNVMLAIPVLNIIVYPMMLLSTAWALRIAVEMQLTTVGIGGVDLFTALATALAILLISPHTYIEFLSYSITFVASSKLMIYMFKRNIDKERVKYYLFLVAVSMAILFIAALIEGLERELFVGA
ncbi:MAG: stage II sporulation protein M [Ignisphaera sp.]